ncbi:MAG TPA: hypothetical protein VIO61_13275 [Anaerolineaceae bacterium]
MKIQSILIVLTLFLVSACSTPIKGTIPAAPTSLPPNAVASQVSQLLTQTAQPAATRAITGATPSQVNPTTAVPQPSATSTITSTPTQTITPTVSSTPTKTSQPTLTPTPTIDPQDPKAALGKPVWTTKETGKSFYKFEDEYTKAQADGNILIMISTLKSKGWFGWSLIHNYKPKNFYLEAVMKPRTCSGQDSYGLMLRSPDDSQGYFFSITCDGRYRFHTFDQTQITNIVSLTTGKGILAGSGQANRLGVKASNNNFSLYVNGNLLKEFTNSAYPDAGYFGPVIASYNTVNFTVELNEISLWNLP